MCDLRKVEKYCEILELLTSNQRVVGSNPAGCIQYFQQVSLSEIDGLLFFLHSRFNPNGFFFGFRLYFCYEN